MPIDLDDQRARLTGNVGVDDLDALAAWSPSDPVTAAVDLAGCRHLHAAVLQHLLARGLRVAALPEDPILAAAIDHATTRG